MPKTKSWKVMMGLKFVVVFLLLLSSMALAGEITIEKIAQVNTSAKDFWDPSFSPDGSSIVFVAYDDTNNQQLFVIDGAGKKQLTRDDRKKWGTAWGPEYIAYLSYGTTGLEKIYLIKPDGTGNRQLIDDEYRQGMAPWDKGLIWGPPSWSPDGKVLVYTSQDKMGNDKIFMVNSDGSGKRQLTNDTSRQWNPSLSPDGKSIVFLSYDEAHNIQLYWREVDGTGIRQITTDEIKKSSPVWGLGGIAYVSYETVSSSGESIFLINPDGTGKRVLFNQDFRQFSPTWSRDGRKILYISVSLFGVKKLLVGEVKGLLPVPTITPPPTPTLPPTPSPSPTQTQIITTPLPTPGGKTSDILLFGFLIILLVIVIIFYWLRKK